MRHIAQGDMNVWLVRIVWMTLVALSGFVGYRWGASDQIRATIQLLQVEATGQVVQRVEALSRLRLGNADAAVKELEAEVEQLVVSMAANPGADRYALAVAKTYFEAVPDTRARSQPLGAALADVAALPPTECKSALQALLASRGTAPLR